MKYFLLSIITAIASFFGIHSTPTPQVPSTPVNIMHTPMGSSTDVQISNNYSATQQATESVSSSTVGTTGWQIYQNSQYGITFEYPSQWGIPTGQLISSNFDTIFEIAFPQPSPVTINYVSGLKNSDGSIESFNDYLNIQRTGLSSSPSYIETSIQVGNKYAVEFSGITPKGTDGGDAGQLQEDYKYARIAVSGSKGNITTISYSYPVSDTHLGLLIEQMIAGINFTQ